jgi:hypothetical protein
MSPRRSRHARRDLLEQFQPLPAQGVFEQDESDGVAAGTSQGPALCYLFLLCCPAALVPAHLLHRAQLSEEDDAVAFAILYDQRGVGAAAMNLFGVIPEPSVKIATDKENDSET